MEIPRKLRRMLREIRWEKTKAPEGPGLRTQEFIPYYLRLVAQRGCWSDRTSHNVLINYLSIKKFFMD